MSHSLKDIFPPKVKITKTQDGLEIDVQENKELLEGDHEITFNLMNFEINQSGNGYYIITKNYDEKIKHVIDYLTKFGYEIYSDSTISQTIQNIENREEILEEAKKIGIQIKKQKHPVGIYPPHFSSNIKIKPYQFKPIQHMLEIGNAANFSVPGSGKTLMTYAVYDILKSKGLVDVLFVVGPISSFGPWQEEYQLCFNATETNVLRYIGPTRLNHLKNFGNYDVILTSYGTATNDLQDLIRDLMNSHKVMMVIDESHHIKRFSENATFANAMIDLGKNAKRRYILTGTPLPRDFEDLWSQITFLWPYNRILGSRTAYRGLLERFDASSEITQRINFLWTRVTNNHLKSDLPKILSPKTDYIQMSEHQEEIYRALENDIWNIENKEIFEEHERSTYRQNKVLRLLQASTNPGVMFFRDPDLDLDAFHTENTNLISLIESYDETPPKLKRTAEIARNIVAKNKNVVIWTVFVKNVKHLFKILSDLNPIEISGEVPTESDDDKEIVGREERINYFKNHTGNVLIATMGSIAESVSLHKACQYSIYLERSFNAGQYMQSLSRIYRIGSDKNKPIQFHFLQSIFRDNHTDTIDGKIDIILKERIKKLYTLLQDEFKLHPLSLETSSYKLRDRRTSVEDEESNLIFKKVRAMVEEHKKKNKI